MSGHYVTEDLAEIARHIQAERLKQQQILTHKSREEIEKARIFEQSGCYRCLSGGYRFPVYILYCIIYTLSFQIISVDTIPTMQLQP